MLGLIKAQAAAGDPAAIRDMNFLRSIGVIKDEPKAEKELMIWELFDMAKEAKKQERREQRKKWLQKSTVKAAS